MPAAKTSRKPGTSSKARGAAPKPAAKAAANEARKSASAGAKAAPKPAGKVVKTAPKTAPKSAPGGKPATPEAWLASLPADRAEPVLRLRQAIVDNLPEDFAETLAYGMLAWVVPHSAYPAGYHCDPAQPLPFLSLANQKGYIALYHMGLYADPKLLAWFTEAYAKSGAGKLDMGKSCIRFKHSERIPYALIGELARKMSPKQWIALYEKAVKR